MVLKRLDDLDQEFEKAQLENGQAQIAGRMTLASKLEKSVDGRKVSKGCGGTTSEVSGIEGDITNLKVVRILISADSKMNAVELGRPASGNCQHIG